MISASVVNGGDGINDHFRFKPHQVVGKCFCLFILFALTNIIDGISAIAMV